MRCEIMLSVVFLIREARYSGRGFSLPRAGTRDLDARRQPAKDCGATGIIAAPVKLLRVHEIYLFPELSNGRSRFVIVYVTHEYAWCMHMHRSLRSTDA